MARIVHKINGKDILETVKWKEYVIIYVQSVVLNFFIVCKNVLLSLKKYFDNRFGPTRQHIASKFPGLSLIRSSHAKTSEYQESIACPHQLMEPQLGSHKYIKLKVRVAQPVFIHVSFNVTRTLIRDAIRSLSSYQLMVLFQSTISIIYYVFRVNITFVTYV